MHAPLPPTALPLESSLPRRYTITTLLTPTTPSAEYLSILEGLPAAKEDSKPPVTGIAKVFLDQKTGPPQHLASGFIYGIPDQPDQIPAHFYRDIHFRYSRAGGSQLPNNRGWARSEAEYEERFTSALSNYRTTRAHDGQFIYLFSDLWGADGGQPKDALWPGDDDDWTRFDALLTRWIADARAAQHFDGLIFDIWNEPDLHFFWNRSKERWLALWSRTYQRVRAELPHLRLTGPSLSAAPSRDNEWWVAFLRHVARTKELPDQWAWHMESGEDTSTMTNTAATFRAMLREHGLADAAASAEINVNEYATFPEQLPSAGAWWIAQLERQDAWGLRGNWAMSGALHDFMAGLVGKPGAGDKEKYQVAGTGYWPTAEYHVYRYYATEMTGERVKTAPTEGECELGDVYATVQGRMLRILAGARARPGQWAVEVSGVPAATTTTTTGRRVKIKTLAFKGDEKDHFRQFDAPDGAAEVDVQVEDGKIVLAVEHKDISTAFAFEVTLPAESDESR